MIHACARVRILFICNLLIIEFQDYEIQIYQFLCLDYILYLFNGNSSLK
jgi:hypothetical protein